MNCHPEGEYLTNYRTAKPLKRKYFRGNVGKDDNEKEKASESHNNSSSSKKIDENLIDDISCDPLFGYRIVEFFTDFTALTNYLICREYRQSVKFEESGKGGLGFKLVIVCKCGRRFINALT